MTPAGHNGVTFLASSGDNGSAPGPEWPSVSPNVVAVGGTRLTISSTNAYVNETGWSGSGGGISRFEPRPAYQRPFQVSNFRTTPDVAYDADPATGVAVFFTNPSSGAAGFQRIGGTSAGAPQWAGYVALVDQGRNLAGRPTLTNTNTILYNLPSTDFHDIVTGSNGGFSAHSGYDLVTGRGSMKADRMIFDLFSVANPTSQAANVGSAGNVSARLAQRSAQAEATDSFFLAAYFTTTAPAESPLPAPAATIAEKALSIPSQGVGPDGLTPDLLTALAFGRTTTAPNVSDLDAAFGGDWSDPVNGDMD
jgi:subtilase family serine protease